MKITMLQVQTMNPCESRFNNFKDNYPNFKGSIKDFLSLEKISYDDKIWVVQRLMTKNQAFYWARAIAYSALEIYESYYPKDNRIRDLLVYLNNLSNVENLSEIQQEEIKNLKSAAYTAANATYAANAAYTANAAYAAVYTANAAYAAAYAANAAYAAAYAANAAYTAANAAARTEQEEFNLIVLAEIMEMDI